MAGIYIHIPFCKQACVYCDFHFTISLSYKQPLIEAIRQEIFLRRNEVAKEPIESIYFGGGTPSLLSVKDIHSILDKIKQFATITNQPEITLEANPDDLTVDYLKQLSQTPVNRLSIGTQSFYNEDLVFMNRAHNAQQALTSIMHAQNLGFSNITIDLIYGSPTTTSEMWRNNLQQWKELNIPHLSAYSLTVEENTPLYKKIQQNKVQPISDTKSAEQFEQLINFSEENNIEHYEISNFCRTGFQAIHNSNYWQNKPYIGLGPSAHSYDGHSIRSWNISNNTKYIKEITSNQLPHTKETLSKTDRINEYLLTRLRTASGIHMNELKQRFGEEAYETIVPILKDEVETGALRVDGEAYKLTKKGKFIADLIAQKLFII